MLIEFKNWDNKKSINSIERTYITVNNEQVGFVERTNNNTRDRHSSSQYNWNISDNLFDTIVETMDIDWVEFYGERKSDRDDHDIFVMFQLAGKVKLSAADKRNWSSKFAKEWMNGVELD